ncbi:hypothetical protein HanIR_Chr15g0765361 [Helianthus annuus]|nr:hypothetical protein HanIR_Chr15g0765361 [Helianthus annuus]
MAAEHPFPTGTAVVAGHNVALKPTKANREWCLEVLVTCAGWKPGCNYPRFFPESNCPLGI